MSLMRNINIFNSIYLIMLIPDEIINYAFFFIRFGFRFNYDYRGSLFDYNFHFGAD